MFEDFDSKVKSLLSIKGEKGDKKQGTFLKNKVTLGFIKKYIPNLRVEDNRLTLQDMRKNISASELKILIILLKKNIFISKNWKVKD